MDITAPSPTVRIFPVLLVNFIGMLGYSIIMPLLVFLVRDFGGNAFVYGILGSTYPAFQLIGAPILGRWSDQIGRRQVLLVSQAGTFLAWILFIVALTSPTVTFFEMGTGERAFLMTLPLLLLFLARALDGLTGGNVSVANAYLSDISTKANRKANFGKMASSTSLGFILGPAIASLLSGTELGVLLPVMAAALISLTAIAVIYRFLPESKSNLVANNLPDLNVRKLFSVEIKECYEKESCPDLSFRGIVQLPHVSLLYLVYFMTFLGFSFFYAGFPLYASGTLNWTPGQLGTFFTVSSLVMVVFQGPVLTYLSDRVSDSFLVSIGSVLISANFFLITLGTDFWIFTAVVLMAMGNGLMWPSFLSILSNSGTPGIQGTIQGYANSVGSSASILGLIFGGILMGQFGPIVFVISGCLFVVLFGLSFLLGKAEREMNETRPTKHGPR
jgi:MFS family permease